MRHLKTYMMFESAADDLVSNARKWSERDFVEEYVNLQDFNYALDLEGKPKNRINRGDKVRLGKFGRDANGKLKYDKNGIQVAVPVGDVIVVDKDYGSDIWDFIMDHTKDVQEEAARLYAANRSNRKPRFSSIPGKAVVAYHASPTLFDRFEHGKESNSGQLGSDLGFFFFLDRRNAEHYASTMEKSYLYEVEVKTGEQLTLVGEEVGTNWTRYSEIQQAAVEGYDTVLIKDADTGYGITDELVVFDDDNIRIKKVTEI
jgi:hypothetical protein